MIKIDDYGTPHYYPLECCSIVNPQFTNGEIIVDDVEMPCHCESMDCDNCIITKVFDEYGKLTSKDSKQE